MPDLDQVPRPLASRPALDVGVIADTHGMARPAALDALRGADLILHAGDVGGAHVLDALRAIAPLVAVRGNNDRPGGARRLDPVVAALPDRLLLELAGRRVLLLHEREFLRTDPPPGPVDVVVFGHSHRPLAEERDGTLWLNPGSAGPRRFRLPVGVARLRLDAAGCRAELLSLPC